MINQCENVENHNLVEAVKVLISQNTRPYRMDESFAENMMKFSHRNRISDPNDSSLSPANLMNNANFLNLLKNLINVKNIQMPMFCGINGRSPLKLPSFPTCDMTMNWNKGMNKRPYMQLDDSNSDELIKKVPKLLKPSKSFGRSLSRLKTDECNSLTSSTNGYHKVSTEAKYRLAKMRNKLGPYVCKLCGALHSDAFSLAEHQCPKIVPSEYKCTICDKVFSSPANLTSHNRWHTPEYAHLKKLDHYSASTSSSGISQSSSNLNFASDAGSCRSHKSHGTFSVEQLLNINSSPKICPQILCNVCHAKFTTKPQLEEHMIAHLFSF